MTHEGEAVCVNELSKSFGRVKALSSFNVHIHQKCVFALVGPNGSGKTTLIRILCSILKPDKGVASVFGRRLPAKGLAGLIGYMPQELALYPDLTVHQNIAFFGSIYGLKRDELNAKERALLRLVGLEDWRNHLVSQLSGGMKRRASLACALVHEPKLVFLDEPTVGVDPELRVAFWTYFEQLRDSGVTILITTHYMDEARRCDVVGMMRGGRLIAQGGPKELLSLTGETSLEDAYLKLSRERD